MRVAQAQLVGWLEGLFHGIQAAMFAQQMAARQQFEEIRRRGLMAQNPQQPEQPGGAAAGSVPLESRHPGPAWAFAAAACTSGPPASRWAM